MVGLEEDVTAECYSCAAEVRIEKEGLTGYTYKCPDCGIELELRLYHSGMKEEHSPNFRANYEGILRELTLAKAPEEEEDWGE